MKHQLHSWLAPLILLPLAAAAVSGCARASDARDGTPAPGRPFVITTTTGMITDIVRQVAGDRAEVRGIMKEGVDPHLYTPTRTDVIKLSEADLVFYNGLMLEGKMADTLVKLARSGKQVYAVTEMLDASYVMTDAQEHYDPHVWMDVQGWSRAVRAVATALGEYDAAGVDEYDRNATGLIERLERLDEYAREVIGSIPAQQRVLVTAHDAFSYLGRAYGIEVRGIQGISTESEAGVKDISELVGFLVEREISAVFVETSVADKNVRALVEGAAARDHEVVIGGSLFSDAMGPSGTWEGTYIGMIDHNVSTIARALGGTVPEGGFRAWEKE
jgi:manganese/zinc/iron transport system substrate-binding protein